MTIVTPSLRQQFSEPEAGWFVSAYHVLASGDLAVLETDEDIWSAWHRAYEKAGSPDFEGAFPAYYSGDARGRVRTMSRPAACVAQFSLEGPFPRFDRTAFGHWIVTASRSNPDEKNGRILDPEGILIRRIAVGDGIRDLQCDTSGGVWVSYFDEGVFGSSVLAANGLNRFSEEGRVLWANSPPERGYRIDDCYALNVSGTTAWFYPYSDFPIVKVDQSGSVQYWSNEVSGARAMAVDGEHIVLAGGYGDQANNINLLRLSGQVAEHEATMTLPMDLDAREARLVEGRGGAIHIVHGSRWYTLSVSDVVRQAARK